MNPMLAFRTFGPALALMLAAPSALADDIPASAKQDTSGIYPDGIDSKAVTGKATATPAIVERVVTWLDGAGEHVAVFAHSDSSETKKDVLYTGRTLYVTTFLRQGGKLKKLQDIREIVPPCELDMSARFIDGSVEVTNVDGDADGELVFAYVTRCAGDVSPMSMKLLMLEGKSKYILRGETEVDVGNGVVAGGGYKPDFGKAPAALLDYAKQLWERFKRTGL